MHYLIHANEVPGRLEDLEAGASRAGEDLFTRNIRVLRLALRAWQADAAHEADASVALMREAAELEVATPKHAVTPGPALPAYELLGDLLMQQKHPVAALAAYRRSLDLYPRRFNGLLGAARAARTTGQTSVAQAYHRELLDLAGGGTARPALEEAKEYMR